MTIFNSYYIALPFNLPFISMISGAPPINSFYLVRIGFYYSPPKPTIDTIAIQLKYSRVPKGFHIVSLLLTLTASPTYFIFL